MSTVTPAQQGQLRRGASDLLRLAPSDNGDDANAEWNLLAEYIINHGDRMVHFSGETVEVVDATPTTRLVVVTEGALYKFPQSAAQTGLFFDARFPIEKIVQVVAVDNDDSLQGHGMQGLDAQVFVSAESGTTVLAFTLNFANFPARRQAFFLALSLVKPGIPILLKRRVNNPDQPDEQQQQQQQSEQQDMTPSGKSPRAGSASASKRVPGYMMGKRGGKKSQDPGTPASPVPKMPTPGSTSNKSGSSTAPKKYSPAEFRSIEPSEALGGSARAHEHRPDPVHSPLDPTAAAAATAATASSPASASVAPAKPLNPEEYERAKKQLHVLLMFDLSPANQLDMLDPGWRTANRPAEESVERLAERDEVRAMIYAKEDKIELDARFREKNPKKALTKFARGVCLEFDKAHEERFVPPELSDEMLLGPALFPLWKQWKASGGLLKVDRGGGDDEDHQWTLFDTNDLISSIRAQEDALLGQIGKKSMVRLQQMRELVEREKKMFINRRASSRRGKTYSGGSGGDMYDDDSETSSTMGGSPSSSRKTTRPVPFRLSSSPNLERAVKRAKPEALDLGGVMKTMKDTLMVHRAKLHDLQKTQLVREINRHGGV